MLRLLNVFSTIAIRNSDTALGEILRTPRPNYAQIEKGAKEFNDAMTIEHRKDREIMAKALAEANAAV